MSATSVLSPTEFQSRLERYLFERSEEWRAVRVGEKEVSEQAEIVARYTDLFRKIRTAFNRAYVAADGRIKEKNGQVLMGPHQVPGDLWIILGMDPQGAMFSLVGPRKH